MVREAKEEIDIDLDFADLELIYTMNRKIPNDERLDFFLVQRNGLVIRKLWSLINVMI